MSKSLKNRLDRRYDWKIDEKGERCQNKLRELNEEDKHKVF